MWGKGQICVEHQNNRWKKGRNQVMKQKEENEKGKAKAREDYDNSELEEKREV